MSTKMETPHEKAQTRKEEQAEAAAQAKESRKESSGAKPVSALAWLLI
jgi:hypothetical protein